MSTATLPALPAESPANLWRRTATLTVILVIAIIASMLMVRSQKRSMRVADIARQAVPSTIIEPNRVWSSIDFNLSEIEMTILETRDYLARTYTDGTGRPVDLSIVFSEDNRKGTHPPDVCLQGAGSIIEQRSDRTLTLPNGQTLPVREVVSRSGTQRTYFAWFYKSGDNFTASFYRQQASIIWNGLLGRNTSGALIRYAVAVDADGGVDAARKRVDSLIDVTFPHIRDKLNAH